MAANFYFEPSDRAFKAYGGFLPKDGVFNAVRDYDKYVTGAGRSIPLDLWLGTALKESTLGRFMKNDKGQPVAMPKGTIHPNPMQAMPDDDNYWKVTGKRFGVTDKDGGFANVAGAMQSKGIDPYVDYAAHKLQEGIDKFKTPERASRWFNTGDATPREKIPNLGKDLLKNSTVQQIVKNIRDFYVGDQYRDKLRAADQPLEGGLF
jgi:hypothetical protein